MPQSISMTGEITLNGKILAIGGVKEKLMAAVREGVKKVILPLANKKDVVDLPAYIIEGLELIYVDEYDEVFNLLFNS